MDTDTKVEPDMFSIDLNNRTECAIAADHLLDADGKKRMLLIYRGAVLSQA